MFHIAKLIFDAAVAGVGYLVADKVVSNTTGKHIHEHIFAWWCEMRDTVQAWIAGHRNLAIKGFVLGVLDKLDGFAVRTKQTLDKYTLRINAVGKQDEEYEVITREISREEALKQFPELANRAVILLPNAT